MMKDAAGWRLVQMFHTAVHGARVKQPVVSYLQLAAHGIVVERNLNAVFDVGRRRGHRDQAIGAYVATRRNGLVPATHASVAMGGSGIEQPGWNRRADRN